MHKWTGPMSSLRNVSRKLKIWNTSGCYCCFQALYNKTGQHNLMILKWPRKTMHVIYIYITIKWVKPGLSKLLKISQDSQATACALWDSLSEGRPSKDATSCITSKYYNSSLIFWYAAKYTVVNSFIHLQEGERKKHQTRQNFPFLK